MMNLISLILYVSISAAAPQGQIRLNCNTPVGPDQQITVLKTADGMVLKELTMSGKTIERPLSEEEWKSGSLTLTENSPDSVTKMWMTEHGWWIESKSPGWNETAPADCF